MKRLINCKIDDMIGMVIINGAKYECLNCIVTDVQEDTYTVRTDSDAFGTRNMFIVSRELIKQGPNSLICNVVLTNDVLFSSAYCYHVDKWHLIIQRSISGKLDWKSRNRRSSGTY